MLTAKSGSFVNVIASIDRTKAAGKFLYVNPSTVTTTPDVGVAGGMAAPTPFDAFELSLRDAADQELLKLRPTVQISGCEGEIPKTALVHEDVPLIPGLTSIALLHDGLEVDRFVAGPTRASTAAALAGMVPLRAGPTLAAKPHKLPLDLAVAAPPRPGVSYTVQVRPQGTESWYTIAVGRPQPGVDLDRNQFPGTAVATVRVLRTNGFEDEVVAQEDVRLD